MKRKTLLWMSVLGLGLIGCGSNDDSAVTTATAASETAGLTDGAADSSADSATATDGNGPILGENPGTIPSPILGEVSVLGVSTFVSPAGYKVYAGDAIDPDTPAGFERFVEHAYLNLEFPCNGGVFGNFEAYPAAMVGAAVLPYAGTFSWTTVDSQLEDASTVVRVVTITSGDQDNTGNTYSLDGIVNGSLIVGSALLDDLVVSRIV